jgi:hypothetical protein
VSHRRGAVRGSVPIFACDLIDWIVGDDKDVADTVLEEAKKAKPEPGKLKRWGHRLGELAAQLGLHVAATEIVHTINRMFGV